MTRVSRPYQYGELATRRGVRVTRGEWEIESTWGSQETAAKAAFAAARHDRKTGLVRPRRVQRKSRGWAVMVKR